jgi:membrane protease YdiL (CAAX protease family)
MSQNLAAKRWFHRAFSSIGISAWVLLGLFGFSSAVITVIFQFIPKSVTHYLSDSTVGMVLFSATLYAIALAIVAGVPLMIQRWSKRQVANLREVLGIIKPLRLKHALVVPLVWVAYFITTIAAATIASMVPGFDATQAQDVGFENLTSYSDLMLGFVGLVILAPLAEELLFRGYLFGKLRAINGFWASAIITSLTFAVAHMQWNVGVDVFVLSLFLCLLREKTGAVWAGVLLHALKNSIAYFLLFIAPLLGINLNNL